jgi:hypothetical protein
MLFQVGHTSTSEWRTVSCFFFSLLVLTEIEVNMATRSCTSTRRALHSLLPFPFLITHQQSNIPNFLPVRHPGIQDSRARNASLSRLPLLHRCEPLLCTVAGSPPTRYVLPSSPLPPTTPAGPSRARRSRILDLEQPLAVDYGAVYSVLQRVSERQRVQPDLWLP